MKKLAGIALASTLLLGACGSNHHESSKSERKVNENKVQFKDDTLVIDDGVMKIKKAYILEDAEHEEKDIVFEFTVKNKSDKDISPTDMFIACTEVKQDDDSTENTLDTGTAMTFDKEYQQWDKHSNDTIKKGKTSKGLTSYKLQNDKKVTLYFTKGTSGKKLGSKTYDLSKLKTVKGTPPTEENIKENDESNDNEAKATESDDKSSKATASTNTNQADDNKQTASTTANSNPKNSESQPNNYEIPKEHSGGHPSLYDPSISPDEQFDGPEYSIEVDQARDEH
ncbi:DUF5067 domain-containing protein [Staphylococcus argensis]|uniref:DUF5067 domain-containing protein n=1 Tax=Staphylococcus argensis TaxID=1607738 RepID=A0A2K4FG80_9STAP|nr:DUF5067 domain-containing protein [Staphylococcus argensis]MCY6990788.1 DUF5067 domain-containing protein [Staphylococcus argensis]POA10307.1 DUF5067 domain-containing protein [Staphylococcus argensis]